MNTGSHLEVPDRRARERERKVDDLLTAAGQVFAAKGFHRASMEDIARSADYATGAIYRYFSGKEALFMGLLERRMSEVMGRVLDEVRLEECTVEALRIVIHSQIKLASQDISLIQIYFSEGLEALRDVESQKRIDRLRLRFDGWLAGRIATGQREGLFRPGDPKLYVMVIQGMVAALFRQWASGVLSPRDWEAQSKFVSQCALRAVCLDVQP